MNDLSIGKTMTVKEVASMLGKDVSTIRKIGKELFPESFKQGITTFLKEKHVTAIKLNLGKNSSLPKTDLEKKMLIQQGYQLLLQEVNDLQQELIEIKPKADFFDQVTSSKDAIDIGSASKVLNIGIGRNRLFAKLREHNVLMDNNQPYQTYIDRGYFRTIEQEYTKLDGSTSINIKTMVYQKGLDYIRKVVK